jgi:hypothetical protein
MKQKKSAAVVAPTDTITSIFTARRDLLQGAKSVVAGSGFTLVAFKELEQFLVHNPSLLSRRLRKLATAKPPLVEVKKPEAGSGLHFNALRARITDEGVKRIKPVWERFSQMSANLLQGISPRLLAAHHEVNQAIIARIRARRQSAKDFLVNV